MTSSRPTCHRCGTPIAPDARYCSRCGKRIVALPARERTGIVVIAVGVVLILAGVAFLVGRSTAGGSAARAGTAIPMSSLGTTDISSMSPREAANRLFDRIMSLSERGVTDSMQFFKPMALQAYAMLGSLDDDAHFDVGMIHAVTGDAAAALAEADTLEAAVPGHLLAQVLRHAVAESRGDSAAVRRAYRTFLRHYDAEIATDRPEYVAHRASIDGFHAAATAALNGKQ